MSPPERQLWPEHPCNKKVAFDLEACGDNDTAGFTGRAVYREPCPLVKKSITIERREQGEMICQMSKVAPAIVTQLAQELPKCRGGVIAYLDVLRRELTSRAFS
jgi:hypothetical protein